MRRGSRRQSDSVGCRTRGPQQGITPAGRPSSSLLAHPYPSFVAGPSLLSSVADGLAKGQICASFRARARCRHWAAGSHGGRRAGQSRFRRACFRVARHNKASRRQGVRAGSPSLTLSAPLLRLKQRPPSWNLLTRDGPEDVIGAPSSAAGGNERGRRRPSLGVGARSYKGPAGRQHGLPLFPINFRPAFSSSRYRQACLLCSLRSFSSRLRPRPSSSSTTSASRRDRPPCAAPASTKLTIAAIPSSRTLVV